MKTAVAEYPGKSELKIYGSNSMRKEYTMAQPKAGSHCTYLLRRHPKFGFLLHLLDIPTEITIQMKA